MTTLHALLCPAGLVSYLPAADPRVYSIGEGNVALPNKLVQAAQLQGLHVGIDITSITLDNATGLYTILAAKAPAAAVDGALGGLSTQSATSAGSALDESQQAQQKFGPFDAVILAAPLEGSGLVLQGLSPEPQLPPRTYQQTTTSFVTGYLDAGFFDRAEIQDGDVFVTNSARTPFTVVAGKGTVSVHAVPEATEFTHCGLGLHSGVHTEDEGQDSRRGMGPPGQGLQQGAAGAAKQRKLGGQDRQHEHEQLPLWKVFSSEPLSWHTLRTLFVNGTVVASKTWAAYPRYDSPVFSVPFFVLPQDMTGDPSCWAEMCVCSGLRQTARLPWQVLLLAHHVPIGSVGMYYLYCMHDAHDTRLTAAVWQVTILLETLTGCRFRGHTKTCAHILGGISAALLCLSMQVSAAGAVCTLLAGSRPVLQQRLGECSLSDGSGCCCGKELCTACPAARATEAGKGQFRIEWSCQ